MAIPTDSFKQFHYGLRLSKQIERKVMIEVLHRLSNHGYSWVDYTYVGFGSVFYIDFIMFHKYLFLEKMICIEWGDIARRMKFNKPFKFITLELGALSSYIAKMKTNKPYLVWLDYDRSLDDVMLQDIDGCVGRIGPRSIFVVTIDARPKLPSDLPELDDVSEMSADDRESLTVQKYKEWFAAYANRTITRDDLSRNHVTDLFYQVVTERIRLTLSQRGGLQFVQLFNYLYRDGAPMFTLGGIVCTESDRTKLEATRILDQEFVINGADYLEISAPPLTIREKHWLDSKLDANLKSTDLPFELEDELLADYRRFYRAYPTYFETLL